MQVFRKDSKKLPVGDPEVEWEETVYLNLAVHQLEYTVTLAVCTRTSPRELQVLRRRSHTVSEANWAGLYAKRAAAAAAGAAASRTVSGPARARCAPGTVVARSTTRAAASRAARPLPRRSRR